MTEEISGKTDISQLPKSNIELEIKEKDNVDLNNIFKQINDVGSKGQLDLPSRDIPMNQSNITMDRESSTNYVPKNEDYINSNYERNEEIIENQRKKQNKQDSLDVLYNELEKPLLLSVLYFLFQLPFMNVLLKKNLKLLFNNEGNLNIYGYIFKSVLFSSAFMILIKGMEYLSD